MRTAIISLESLYNYIRQAHGYPSSPPSLPPRRSKVYSRYRRICESLIQDVSGFRAVYLWFAVEFDTKPEYIYVGQSQKSTIGLHRRFSDEFRQWYHIFWMKAFNSDRYAQDAIDLYNTPTKDYSRDIRNQTLKHGATHLAYCTNLSESLNIDSLESELIFLFNRPRGNEDVPTRKPPTFSADGIAIRDKFLSLVSKCTPYSLSALD